MAEYYALVKDGYIQREVGAGLLTIFEDEDLAIKYKSKETEVVRVTVSKSNK